jgi:pimeloyl-ACP methyl ester carboxylesterase
VLDRRLAAPQNRGARLMYAIAVVAINAFFGIGSSSAADSEAGRAIDLPNVKLWVFDSGGSGPPVLLLHPTTGTSDIWAAQVPALVKAGFRVITIDKPGWGRSYVTPGRKPISLAEDIDQLVERLALPKFHLVGIANGGYVAVDYATWRPERVRSLVISSSGLGLTDDPEGDAFRARAAIPGFEKMPAEVREMSPTYRGAHPEGVTRWKDIQAHARQPGALEPPLRSPNTLEKVASIRTPLLVIAGDVDLTTPSGAVRLWTKHLTEPYEFDVVPEAGHAVSWEQPDIFNRDMIAFMRKH